MNMYIKIIIFSFFTIAAHSKDYSSIITTSLQISHLKNSCKKLLQNNKEDPLAFKFEDYFCKDDPKVFELETKRDGTKYMILSSARCQKDGIFTVQIDFSNVGYVLSSVHNKSLTGEGFFYKEKNSICIINNSTNFVFTLWFPSKLSLKSRSSPIGKLWSKPSGTIGLKNVHQNELHYTCSEYQYTCTNTALELMQLNKKGSLDLVFPRNEYHLQELMFPITLKKTNGRSVSGHAILLFANEKVFCDSPIVEPRLVSDDNFDYTKDRKLGIWNVSYSIVFNLEHKEEVISAEGVYDTETGILYMVGCRSSSFSKFFQGKKKLYGLNDCDVRMQIMVPHLDSKRDERFSGKLWSSRSKVDLLYFEPVEVISQGRADFLMEMDMEMDGYSYVDEWMNVDRLILVVFFASPHVFVGFLFFLLRNHM